jgi:hypothetical protein
LDVIRQRYLYPILLHGEKDPAVLKFYQPHMDTFMINRRNDKNPLMNFYIVIHERKK